MHKNSDAQTEFYQIHTNTSKTLELTARHMLFFDGEAFPKAARDVRIGDLLAGIEGPQEVLDISKINITGFYDPVTEDGTVVVDGFVASSFASFHNRSIFANEKVMAYIDHQTLSQVATAPLRFVCKTVLPGLCSNPGFLNEEGLHTYVIFLKKARDLSTFGQVVAIPIVLGFGIFFSILEFTYDNFVALSISLMAVVVSFCILWKKNSRFYTA